MNEGHLQYLASDDWAHRLQIDLLPWLEQEGELGDDVLEVGPGPGLTTDLLRQRASAVTAVEVDEALASALAERLRGTNVTVLHGDGADTGLPSERFSTATCFSVLHHVPSAQAQDQVLAEIRRLLRPGGALFVTDSRDMDGIRQFHHDDVFVPLDLDTLAARLERLGFSDVDLDVTDHEIRFRARKPAV